MQPVVFRIVSRPLVLDLSDGAQARRNTDIVGRVLARDRMLKQAEWEQLAAPWEPPAPVSAYTGGWAEAPASSAQQAFAEASDDSLVFYDAPAIRSEISYHEPWRSGPRMCSSTVPAAAASKWRKNRSRTLSMSEPASFQPGVSGVQRMPCLRLGASTAYVACCVLCWLGAVRIFAGGCASIAWRLFGVWARIDARKLSQPKRIRRQKATSSPQLKGSMRRSMLLRMRRRVLGPERGGCSRTTATQEAATVCSSSAAGLGLQDVVWDVAAVASMWDVLRRELLASVFKAW